MQTIKELLSDLPIQWGWTCVSPAHEHHLRALVESVPHARIAELGTHHGTSAGFFATMADHVVTIDVLPNPLRKRVWDRLRVTEKITEHVHKSQEGRDRAIMEAAEWADLFFIDGSHLLNDVAHDTLLTEACKVRIYDDYDLKGDWPDVKTFIDGMDRGAYDVTVVDRFALVRRK